MKIRRDKNNLYINTENKEVVVWLDADREPVSSDVIINLTKTKLKGIHTISTPGEYELADVLVNTFAVTENMDFPSIVSIDSDENIKLLYLSEDVSSVGKVVLDRIPKTNILVMSLRKDNLHDGLQLVNDLEPDIFLPLLDRNLWDGLAKDLGVKETVEVGTLSISQKDFTEETSDLLVYFLK